MQHADNEPGKRTDRPERDRAENSGEVKPKHDTGKKANQAEHGCYGSMKSTHTIKDMTAPDLLQADPSASFLAGNEWQP